MALQTGLNLFRYLLFIRKSKLEISRFRSASTSPFDKGGFKIQNVKPPLSKEVAERPEDFSVLSN